MHVWSLPILNYFLFGFKYNSFFIIAIFYLERLDSVGIKNIGRFKIIKVMNWVLHDSNPNTEDGALK